MAKVIMTERQYVERLEAVAARKTQYKNKYPYNLLYIHKEGYTSGDCLNTIKAILNGYNVFETKAGYYQRDLSNTGDVSELGLLNQCSDISSDFKNLGKHPLLLYMKGHVGSYLGKEVGGKYNVIECTTSFGGGVVYSWVDADGIRRKEKGGARNGQWTKHGRFTPWIEYAIDNKEGTETDTPKSKYHMVHTGETLSGIAKQYGLTLSEILRLNPQIKNPNIIRVGEKITLEVIKVEYIVKTGDTLSSIAKHNGMSLGNLLELNPQITNPNLIKIGQKIRIR